ncbi:inverse autotransporter beta domain-containing protein [Stenotrophomonas acidaminiphila]|uniref:inverse autotransporter beta domain-containing protein n=1 Tax=Stenotrophomonas acidaminiphila TaxID=128780 RepID=UPI0015F8BBE8|nr:inverse autotransporter beta domain-containing protein [Stenotrophomonas acidaminiphila]
MFLTDIAKRFVHGIVALSLIFTPVTPAFSQTVQSPSGDEAIKDRIDAANAALPRSSDPSQFLYGQIAGAAQQAVVDGLRPFGNAKVQLDTQGGGSVDLLHPLGEDATNLWFFQGGVRRSNQLYRDYRTTLNAGLGYRRLIGDTAMVGINGFFDADVTGGNRRLGVGAEYWSDYLKVSANGYFGVNRVWNESPDVEFYSEKPASGFDVIAQGYLPQLPQLGGKVAFERYYGDSVGLFGFGAMQRDPYAYTVGLTYQPAPALSFDVSRRMGQGGESDTAFRVGLNFRFGVPLNRQFDFSHEAVARTRDVRNMRYDLVERNNNIVLKYKRQADNFSITLPDGVSGHPGERITFPISISDGSCDAIVWEGGAAGFVESCSGSEVVIRLPDTNVCAVHELVANGQSRQGRAIRARMSVSILCSASVLVVADPAVIAADGNSTSILTATVKDANGEPMQGIRVEWTSTAGTLADSNSTTDGEGRAKISLTSTTTPGTATVTAKAGAASGTTDVAFVTGAAANVAVSASPASITADGSSTQRPERDGDRCRWQPRGRCGRGLGDDRRLGGGRPARPMPAAWLPRR